MSLAGVADAITLEIATDFVGWRKFLGALDDNVAYRAWLRCELGLAELAEGDLGEFDADAKTVSLDQLRADPSRESGHRAVFGGGLVKKVRDLVGAASLRPHDVAILRRA